MISILNPKIALFFSAIFSHFVHPDFNWTRRVIMGLATGVIDGLWYVAVSSTLTEVGIRRISNSIENVLRNISGSLLIVVAFYMMLIILRDLI